MPRKKKEPTMVEKAEKAEKEAKVASSVVYRQKAPMPDLTTTEITAENYLHIDGIRTTTVAKACVGCLEDLVVQKDYVSPYMEEGTVAHAIILEPEKLTPDKNGIPVPPDVVLCPFEHWMGANAKERKFIRTQGKIPMLMKDYVKMYENIDLALQTGMGDMFSDCYTEKPFLKDFSFSESNLSAFGKIKGKLDAIKKDNSLIVDLKTTRDKLNPAGLDARIFNFGYQVQLYIYMMLADVEQAVLCFYSILGGTYAIKTLSKEVIRDEVESLLGRGAKILDRVEAYERGVLGSRFVYSGEYETPQWAYRQLIETHN